MPGLHNLIINANEEAERFLLKLNCWSRSIFSYLHYPTQNRYALLLEMLYVKIQ